MNLILLAQAVKVSPHSSGYRDFIAASYRYGLTTGSYKSESIALTPLGEALTAPRTASEELELSRKAMRSVAIYDQMLAHFSNNKLPPVNFLKNTLIREPFSVPSVWAEEVAASFTADGEMLGFVRQIGDSSYVVLDAGAPVAKPDSLVPGALDEDTVNLGDDTYVDSLSPPVAPTGKAQSVQIFVAHGRSRKPLEQLQKILSELQIPYVVAVDEPHAGRPISLKVAELMHACSAGIFIFTADEELRDTDGTVVRRPSQNVIFELGAASLLYGKRIVIFKEKGVTFPSDFSDMGWIDFDGDDLAAKSLELIRELIALKAVRLVSATSE